MHRLLEMDQITAHSGLNHEWARAIFASYQHQAQFDVDDDSQSWYEDLEEESLTTVEVLDEFSEPLPSRLDRYPRRFHISVLRKGSRSRLPKSLLYRRKQNCEDLQHPFDEELAAQKRAQKEAREDQQSRRSIVAKNTFSKVRSSVIQTFGPQLKENLSQIFKGPVEISEVDVGKEVQERFLNSYNSNPEAKLIPAYHGSLETNYPSICERGLLIPGKGNGISVAHGSAHGRGIYTACLKAPNLSRSFCDKPRLLVCGVLDDADALLSPELCGSQLITSQSKVIRHVGAAVVVFDESRVVPLFEARAEDFEWKHLQSSSSSRSVGGPPGPASLYPRSSRKTQKKRSQQPEKVFLSRGKGKVMHIPSLTTAFLPPDPMEGRFYISKKRMVEKRRWKETRHILQDIKMRANGQMSELDVDVPTFRS